MLTDAKRSHRAEVYEAVADYSTYSTLAGLVYLFMPNVPLYGKIFWAFCIFFMLSLGTYWSIFLYIDWQDKPVLTTVTSTALPVAQVPFPAVTVCSEGYDIDFFDAALFKLFFDFIKKNGVQNFTTSPYEASLVNNQWYVRNLTKSENATLTQLIELQKQYWAKFLNASFPGISPDTAFDINHFDWLLIMFNQKFPHLYAFGYWLQNYCQNVTNVTCFENLMDPSINDQTRQAMSITDNMTRGIMKGIDFTPSFLSVFPALWMSKLPCFETLGMSGSKSGERGILKKCKWKDVEINCSAIFTTFPTDQGMCCSFNMKAADEIFTSSQFTTSVKQLQAEDFGWSLENPTLPEDYITKDEPKSQAGRNMGLEVVLDAHSNLVESFSVGTDFEGFTGLITESGSFPLTNQKGFEIRPGHNNLVAVSAIMIDADDDLRMLKPDIRKCLFPDEKGNLTLFKNYSQSNCLLECSLKYAQRIMSKRQNFGQGCTPWFFPFTDNAFKMCDPYETKDIRELMKNIPSDECSYCLPDCIRTMYDQKITAQPFRRCDERNLYLTDFCKVDLDNVMSPQIWAQQVFDDFLKRQGKVPAYLSKLESSIRTIKESYVLANFFPSLNKNYDAYEKDIAVLNVFFDSPTVMQFMSQPRQSWTDYFAAVGGALGLCIGLSIMTLVEFIFLCFQMGGTCKKPEEDPDEVKNFSDD